MEVGRVEGGGWRVGCGVWGEARRVEGGGWRVDLSW